MHKKPNGTLFPEFIASNYLLEPLPGKMVVRIVSNIPADQRIRAAVELNHAAIRFNAAGGKTTLRGVPYTPIDELPEERGLPDSLTFILDTSLARDRFVTVAGFERGIIEIYAEQLGASHPQSRGR